MREAEIRRETTETAIRVRLVLDGSGTARIATGIGFTTLFLLFAWPEYTCTGTFCHVAKCSDTLNVRQVPRPDSVSTVKTPCTSSMRRRMLTSPL